MLVVLSPAKTMDFAAQKLTRKSSTPEFLAEAEELAAAAKKLSPKQLGKLMAISERLADGVYENFAAWQGKGLKPAVLAFQGDVYQGLRAETFAADDFAFAQEHLRILSGLYGVLRPLDKIEPYRLEMGADLKNTRGKNLYKFWGDAPTGAIRRALAKQKDDVLVNLASQEYFGVLDPEQLNARIITPAFKDFKNGSYKFMSYFAKRARGAMARYLVTQRVSEPEEIKRFDGDGYRFNAELSRGDEWVFTRKL